MLGFPGDGSHKDRRWHWVPERTVWPFVIIQVSPVFDHHPGLCQALEELGIETFTAKRAVEAFVTAILPGFAWFEPTRDNLLVFQKRRQVVGDEFWAVVTAKIPRASITGNEPA